MVRPSIPGIRDVGGIMGKTSVNKRREGAKGIIRQARDLATAAGLKLPVVVFDNGRVIIGLKNHTLTMASGEKVVQVELSEAELEAYPNGGDREATLTKIRCGIDELLAA